MAQPDVQADNATATQAAAGWGDRPAPLAVGNDVNGHGTHIAAAADGSGIVGVAPNVKIAGIKAGNNDGSFFSSALAIKGSEEIHL